MCPQVMSVGISPLDFVPEATSLALLFVDVLLLPLMLWAAMKLLPDEVRGSGIRLYSSPPSPVVGDFR